MNHYRDPIEWEDAVLVPAGVRPSSLAWRASIKALYGSPLTDAEHATFLLLSGGREPPAGGVDDFLAVVGRRGGKSEQIGRLAVFEALHAGHAIALAPGQQGVIPVISPVREQSAEILGYVKGLAGLRPIKSRVAKILDASGEVVFTTGIAIRVTTADVLSVSGPTVVALIWDEKAKLPGAEAAVPDFELEASARPALAPVNGAPTRRSIGITSAYIESGVAFATDRDHFGKPDAPVLVVRGTTEQFNPNIDAAWLDRERRRNPRTFAREYMCEWQPAIVDSWFGGDVIEQNVDEQRIAALPFEKGRRYFVTADAAFKSDRFAVSVATSDAGPLDARTGKRGPRRTIVVWAWVFTPKPGAPLSPEACVKDTAAIVRAYGEHTVYLDQFAAEPLKESFARHGIRAIECTWTAQSKAPRFRTVREAMLDAAFRLPNHRALIAEMHAIRGVLLQSGGERIEARRGHDDIAHAVVMAGSLAIEKPPSVAEKDLSAWEHYERDEKAARLAGLGSAGDYSRVFGGGSSLPSPDEINEVAAQMRLEGKDRF